MKQHYPEAVCPDCGEPIPDDAVAGNSCVNCDHVFVEPTPSDDDPPEDLNPRAA